MAYRPDPPTRDNSAPSAAIRRRGRVILRAVGGPHRGDHYEIQDHRVVRGGRGQDGNQISLPRDELVSRVHFSLETTGESFLLRDEGSRNGVFVGGARVPTAVLTPDAVFRAGDSELQLAHIDAGAPPQPTSDHFGELYGWSTVMRALFTRLEKLAGASPALPILITGATGTGKELVARGLHTRSSRASSPFIVLDCTALPLHLTDAIVFGYNRGAYTGAAASRPGVFEEANGGTLFIDELGELPLDLQSKLLRILDRRQVSRFDDPAHLRAVDVRVICATNRDLRRMVDEHRFRDDLYHRIAGVQIALPSLCEREDDAVRLAERFIAAQCEQPGTRPHKSLTPAARQAIRDAPWPGNVRELVLAIRRAVELTDAPDLDVASLDLNPTLDATTPDLAAPLRMPWPRAQEAFQAVYLRALMSNVGTLRGRINEAAAQAGMDRSGLVKALKRLGLYHKQDDE